MKRTVAKALLLLSVGLGALPAGQCVLMLIGWAAPCCQLASDAPAATAPACCAKHAAQQPAAKSKPCLFDPTSDCRLISPTENLAGHATELPAAAIDAAPILAALIAYAPFLIDDARITNAPDLCISPQGPPTYIQLRTILI